MLLFSTLKTPEQEGTQFCGDRRALGGANTVSLSLSPCATRHHHLSQSQ